MYSSEDENSEEEIECQNPSEENSKQDDEEEEESEADFVDFDNDDIDALLEGNDGYGLKTEQEKADKVPLILSLEKHILVEKSNHHFEFLPNGWLKVIHQSGMPVYFHRETRICTLSRPYGLGKASLRAHKIPVSAIPCLEYQRAKEEETKIRTEPVERSAFCPLGQVY
jgi:microprocessor complex subunit DGCR8